MLGRRRVICVSNWVHSWFFSRVILSNFDKSLEHQLGGLPAAKIVNMTAAEKLMKL
jgi:hypothetical protein